MTTSADSMTVSALTLALDAAVLRQQVIASNIANASTAGYQPQRVTFDVHVQRAWQMSQPGSTSPSTLGDGLSMTARVAPSSAGEATVQLDQEVAAMAQNTTHYQLLLRGLNRHFSLLASAVSEGKR